MRTHQAVFATEYWGEVFKDQEGDHSVSIFGFENVSPAHRAKSEFTTDTPGTYWGFVQSGAVDVEVEKIHWSIQAGQWFCVSSGGQFRLRLTSSATRIFTVFSRAHTGLFSMGGPVEPTGRLRYIDGCTDTILYPPPLKGDPCLNLLHFPQNVDQTQHFHPSSRCGIVNSGKGQCVSEHGVTDLVAGQIFYLPKNLRHKFRTDGQSVLNVISYHPDSDWGPTHEVHPMINRTWTDTAPETRDRVSK